MSVVDPEIRAALREVLTDAGAEIWLHRPNRLLDGDTPAQRIAAGDRQAVLDYLAAMGEGVFL